VIFTLNFACWIAALYFYEYVITFDQEVNHIWAKKWSLSTLIFAVNRYTALAVSILMCPLVLASYAVSLALPSLCRTHAMHIYLIFCLVEVCTVVQNCIVLYSDLYHSCVRTMQFSDTLSLLGYFVTACEWYYQHAISMPSSLLFKLSYIVSILWSKSICTFGLQNLAIWCCSYAQHGLVWCKHS
jgi:hypothetical protein